MERGWGGKQEYWFWDLPQLFRCLTVPHFLVPRFFDAEATLMNEALAISTTSIDVIINNWHDWDLDLERQIGRHYGKMVQDARKKKLRWHSNWLRTSFRCQCALRQEVFVFGVAPKAVSLWLLQNKHYRQVEYIVFKAFETLIYEILSCCRVIAIRGFQTIFKLLTDQIQVAPSMPWCRYRHQLLLSTQCRVASLKLSSRIW